ncbi:MAG: class I SAM-dependent methyltransferase [Myxococcales bacterium]|nr:class I SAM-dependent methyltransferase [Myxococcales bacterium]
MARGRFGRWYDREVLSRVLDLGMRGVDELRASLLTAARGRVLEIGFGTGSNLPHYPAAVDSLVAVEPSEGLASVAGRRLAQWGRPHEVVVQSGSRPLPLAPASFDTVVITFVLCSARRVPELLTEARRMLRSDGALLIAEHQVASGSLQRACQRALRPAWKACLGGCDPTARPREHLQAAGFDTSGLVDTRLRLPWIVRPGLVGVARVSGE